MKRLKYLDLDVFVTSPGRYAVKYAGETFNFVNWQDVVSWIRHIRQHEKANGYERTNGQLTKAGGSSAT